MRIDYADKIDLPTLKQALDMSTPEIMGLMGERNKTHMTQRVYHDTLHKMAQLPECLLLPPPCHVKPMLWRASDLKDWYEQCLSVHRNDPPALLRRLRRRMATHAWRQTVLMHDRVQYLRRVFEGNTPVRQKPRLKKDTTSF